MPASRIIPVILSDGAGSQLWPLWREHHPGQFRKFGSDFTLFQEAALRISGDPVVVCNHEHRFILAGQLAEVGVKPRAVMLEPHGRNSAPAVTLAALLLAGEPDATMLVMPADHAIGDRAAFGRAIERATTLAASGHLVAFGTRSSGLYLFPVALFLDEMERLAPALLDGCREVLKAATIDLSFMRLPAEHFAALPALSIGDALMAHTARGTVVPVDMGWPDAASWSAVLGNSARDDDGNTLVGDVAGIGNSGCYIRSESCLVAAVGLRDMVVVVTDDAVLVADKHRDHEVKALVEGLKGGGRPEVTHGPRCYRPWGWFETVDRGERFQVKHIHVNAGARLSLQKHWHRSEHWVVVTGTAVVTKGNEVAVLRENQSTYIPAGTVHRLENPGRLPLKLIEVQSGEYVGEDDIVRLEDSYGR